MQYLRLLLLSAVIYSLETNHFTTIGHRALRARAETFRISLQQPPALRSDNLRPQYRKAARHHHDRELDSIVLSHKYARPKCLPSRLARYVYKLSIRADIQGSFLTSPINAINSGSFLIESRSGSIRIHARSTFLLCIAFLSDAKQTLTLPQTDSKHAL